MFLIVILDAAVSFKGNATVLQELLGRTSSLTQLEKKKPKKPTLIQTQMQAIIFLAKLLQLISTVKPQSLSH